MSVASLIRAMRAAGVPADKILDTVEGMENERLAKGRLRQAKHRNSKNNGDVTSVTSRYARDTPLSPKEIPPTPPKEITPIPVSEPSGSSTVSLETEFESDFWPAYPRRVGKGQALKAFRTVRKRGVPLEAIMGGVRRYAAERQGEDANFTKHAATWLNGICWEDEPAPAPMPRSGAPPPLRHEPRTVAERAIQRLQTGQLRDEPTSHSDGCLDLGDGRGQAEGHRGAQLIALATAAISRPR